jgi:hypothetical protein
MAHGVAEAVEKACQRHDVLSAYQIAIESHREAIGIPYGSPRETMGKHGKAIGKLREAIGKPYESNKKQYNRTTCNTKELRRTHASHGKPLESHVKICGAIGH